MLYILLFVNYNQKPWISCSLLQYLHSNYSIVNLGKRLWLWQMKYDYSIQKHLNKLKEFCHDISCLVQHL